MAKGAAVRLDVAADGRVSLKIQCLAASDAAEAARAERLGKLGLQSGAAQGAKAMASLRPGGPSLRPAGPLAPPSPKRKGPGPPDALGARSSAAKIGSYQYTKEQLIEHGNR